MAETSSSSSSSAAAGPSTSSRDDVLRREPAYWHTFTTNAKMRWYNRRILDVLVEEFRDRTKHYYTWAIHKGLLKINAEKVLPGYVVRNGDVITHTAHKHEPPITSDPVRILYRNDEQGRVVVVKPGSVPVHPAGRYLRHTLLELIKSDHGIEKVFTANRLDRLTSGIMVASTTTAAAKELAADFESGRVRKAYVCRVKGCFPEAETVCEEPLLSLDRQTGVVIAHPLGRTAKTIFNRLSYDGETDTSVLFCRPITGRTHQIRVHAQLLGHVIPNDPIYAHPIWQEYAAGSLKDIPVPSTSDVAGNHNTNNAQQVAAHAYSSAVKYLASTHECASIIEALKNSKDEGEDWSRLKDEVRFAEWNEENGWKEGESVSGVNAGPAQGIVSSTADDNEGGYCEECFLPLLPDPPAEALFIYLHAIRYETDDWSFEDEMPWWARDGWREPDALKKVQEARDRGEVIRPPRLKLVSEVEALGSPADQGLQEREVATKHLLQGDKSSAAPGAEGGAAPEESIVVSNSVQARLKHALGEERFSRTMATVFCLRQDPAFNVRDAAASTWKAIIVNTAKTIRELLTMIIDLVIRALSTDGEDQREIASRTLGELTRKLGGSVLESIVPLLQERGTDAGSSASVRAGVMLAVESLLENATDVQLEDHQDALIGAVRHGLVDRSPVVRQAAASAFDALQDSVGQKAIEAIIPTLLGALQHRGDSGADESLADTSLAALREVMKNKADVVFPASLPTLLVQPISAFNARALGDLVGVAGNAINRKVGTILSALSLALEQEEDEEVLEAINESIENVLTAVRSFEALHQLMMFLLGWAGDVEKDRRKILHACRFYTTFATNLAERGGGRAMEDYNADWLRRLVSLLDNRDSVIVDAALPALAACVETMEDPEELVVSLRHALSSLPGEVAGLAKKEGFGSCSAVFLAGLMSGTGEQKEQAAIGLGILVEKADPVAIKPFVTTGLAGPLIRACGERHAAAVKAAILSTLDICLKRIPQHLKPFYPQLSRSFLKAVSDPTGLAVRNQAGLALGTLSTIPGTRLDLNALLTSSRSGLSSEPSSSDYPDGAALALSHILLKSEPGNAQVLAVKDDIVDLIDSAFAGSEEERFKIAIGEVLSGLALHDASAAQSLVEKRVLPTATDPQLASLCLTSLMENAADVAYGFGHASKMAQLVSEFIFAGPTISRPARESRELMRSRSPWAADDDVIAVLSK